MLSVNCLLIDVDYDSDNDQGLNLLTTFDYEFYGLTDKELEMLKKHLFWCLTQKISKFNKCCRRIFRQCKMAQLFI